MTNIPQIADLGIAVRMYYEKRMLSSKDILTLFGGKHSGATITRLKKMAEEKMICDNVCFWNARMVDTETAFKAWGLDIANMEHRYAKLKKYGFVANDSAAEHESRQ